MLQPVVKSILGKGQIVIPSIMRKYLGLTPKVKVLIWLEPQTKRLILERIEEDPIELGCGLLSDWEESPSEIMKKTRKEEAKYEKKD